MSEHQSGCPRLQAWDLGEYEAPCTCEEADTPIDPIPAALVERFLAIAYKIMDPDRCYGSMWEEARQDVGRALARAYLDGQREAFSACEQIATAEPELDDAPNALHMEAMEQLGPVITARAAVRATKRAIVKSIRRAAAERRKGGNSVR